MLNIDFISLILLLSFHYIKYIFLNVIIVLLQGIFDTTCYIFNLSLYSTSLMTFIIIVIPVQASLIGHMDKLHLLEPSTIFMEFGAGRGEGVVCSEVEREGSARS